MMNPAYVSRMLPIARRARRRLRAVSALLALCWAAGCMDGGGSGSETTLTGITGKVVDPAGNPVPGTAVYVRPEGALPAGILGSGGKAEPEEPWTKTASDGSFRIQGLAPGDYVAEFRAPAGAAVLGMRAADTLVRLPDAVLRPTGAVRGKVVGLSDGRNGLLGFDAFLPGLLTWTSVDIRGRDTAEFLLGDIPAGTHALRIIPKYPVDMQNYKILELPAVRIDPGDTADAGALLLPSREGPRDSAYMRDSAAVAALLRANGIDEKEVSRFSGAMGNRITMLFDAYGRITRLSPELGELDQVDYLNLIPVGDTIALEGAAEIGRLRGLRLLQLVDCKLDGYPDWLGALPKLEELVLMNVGLRRFPEELATLPFLQRVTLWSDSLGTLPASISGMRRLRALAVGNAGLSDLPDALAAMEGLVSLDLAANRFESVPAPVLKLDQLRRLDLDGNRLASLPEGLMRMPALRGFKARGNRLCGLPPVWKEWLKVQDSLWYASTDTLYYSKAERDSGWEASQHCPAP